MKKRFTKTALSVCIAFTFLLAACSNTKDPVASTGTVEPSATPVATESIATPVATESIAPQETAKKFKGEIVISLPVNPSSPTGGFDALTAAYNKLQPDVKVTWEPHGGTSDQYPTWLSTQLAVGSPRPDIVSGNYAGNYDKYVNFDKYRFTTNPYTQNKWQDDFNWDFCSCKNPKGERIMIATQTVHVMWYYNKDIFDRLGLQPPTNWDELVKVAETIKKAGTTPIASNFIWKVPGWLFEVYNDQFTRGWHDIVRAQKGDYNYNDDVDGQFKADPKDPFIDTKYNFNQARYYKAIKDGKIRFDTPEMSALITNMAKVFPKYAQKDFYVSTEDYQLFLQQKAAIMIDGSWSLPQVTQDMQKLNDPKRLKELNITGSGLKPFNWGTFENPPMTDSLVQGPIRAVESSTGDYVSIVNKNQEQTDMVLDFVKFWMSKAGYQPYVDGLVKAGIFTPGGPIMINGITVPDDIKVIFDKVKMLGNAEIVMNQGLATRVGDIDKTINNLYKDALEGKITPDQFGKSLEEQWTKNFDAIVKNAGLTPNNIDHPELAPGS